VSRRFPELLAALAENRMSLTVAGLLSPVLEENNVDRLLSDCAGMTSREVEEYLVVLRPKPVFTPSIRKAPSPPATTFSLQVASDPAPPVPRPVPRVSPTILEPAKPEVFNFRFAADRRFKQKFERLAEVLGVPNPLQHMAEIMEQAMDIALDKKDLKRKHARRLAREARNADHPRKPHRAREISAKNGYLPSQKRERVHERAGHQCEYRGPDGTRCRSTTGLQIEHLLPFALYRTHDEKHLRIYCSPHNRLAAEKVFGREFIQNKINASRQKRKDVEQVDSA